MAEKKIFDLIPASLQDDLIEEVKEILAERKKQQAGKVDTDVVEFAKKQNENALKAKNKK